MKRLSRARVALLVLVLALVAAACSGGGGEGEQTAEGGDTADAGGAATEGGGDAASEEGAGSEGGGSGGEFSVYISEPEHISPPSNVTESGGGEVLNGLYAPLVEVDLETPAALTGDDAPTAVAESVESEDNQEFTITLKDGWTMHNGEPLTAQNYVDAWNYGAYGPNANTGAYFFANIEGYDDLQCPEGTGGEGQPECTEADIPATEMSGLEVVDDRTFTVRLTEPFSIFPLVLRYSAFHPVPSDFLDDPEQYVEQPVGNGPFMMDGPWQHDELIRVVRYDDYAGEPAKADAVEYSIYAEVDTAYNDLLAGNLDVMDAIPAAQLDAAEAQFGERFIRQESPVIQFLGFPTYDPAFENPDLRKAFSMAIDREAISTTVRPDFAPLAGFVPEVIPGALADGCGGNCEYNPEEAARLFEEAGGYEGTLTLWYNSGADHDPWIEAVSNQLRQNLGIANIEFQSLDFAEYLPLLQDQGITGPYRLGWIPDYPSPHTYLDSLYSTGASSNYTGYSNPEFDALIAEGEAAEDPEASVEPFQEAERILNEDMPAIPMFVAESTGAYSERVENVEITFFDEANVADIEVVEP